MTHDKDPLLTGPKVAEKLGIQPATLRKYVERDQFPKPDQPDLDTVANRRQPKWRTSTVDRFIQDERAGPGTNHRTKCGPTSDRGDGRCKRHGKLIVATEDAAT